MLPVGVLIPTRNSMALLPEHLGSMLGWIDRVEEIVVVDSNSRDGTQKFLREKLAGRKVRFLDHPPGLYESWNFGIERITSRYTYISTVGDGITCEGLEHLVEVAEEESCDVVISPPRFVDRSGRAIERNSWPIHDMVRFLDLKGPACLEGVVTFAVALSFFPFAILGSSASDLYRTAILRRNPFPTDFGMNGDGAWGVFNALRIRLGITPKCVGTFRHHEKSYSFLPYAADGDQRMLDRGLRLLGQFLHDRPEMKAEAQRIGLDDFIAAKVIVQQWRTALNWHRQLAWPWVINPAAWRARRRRAAAQLQCEALVKELLTSHSVLSVESPAA